ncbi:MAG: DUF1553 domain-containing protein [Acidobacteria bacterium]|nr:DUF1553 domain-containing protein [Acidobacteriota bacterium]
MSKTWPQLRGRTARQWTAMLLAFTFIPVSIAQEQEAVLPLSDFGGANCTFKADPDEYTSLEARVREAVNERAIHLTAGRQAGASRSVAPDSIKIRGFVDQAIFGKLIATGTPSARLTTDEEFVRRIYLDLTGRIPTLDQYRAFMSDSSARKRSELIDRLLYSREFTDKWSMWFGDLIQYARANSFRSQSINARNQIFGWIAKGISENRSLKDLSFELLTAKGNTANPNDSGAATWFSRWSTPGGPIEDTYDTLFSRSATIFMGMSHYDCLLCHDGRGRLEQLSLWGRRATRMEAYQMAAYFSRVRFFNRGNMDPEFPNSTDVSDATTGNYNMNTTFGNRPRRVQIGLLRSANAAWRMGDAEPNTSDWRAQFAVRLTNDRMFARNFANRLWKSVFTMGLVEPVDQLDPARLDPKNPPTGEWSLQATHPELLERLADELIDNNFNLREFLRALVESNAYQLSSDYGDGWRAEYVPLFARHYVRRLEGEEIHDAMQIATNVIGRYTIGGWADPVSWAMQMPEPVEPASNGGVRDFMNLFLRGDRNTQYRNQDGSILQQLNLMNNGFVISRAKVNASTVLRAIAMMTDTKAMTEELFLRFLGRMPSESERTKTVAHLARAGNVQNAKNAAVEDMAWVLMNKQEFIFSY